MDARRAIRLIEGGIPDKGGLWADLGCGDGAFTLALVELIGAEGRVYAVDKDPGAISKLRKSAAGYPNVIPVIADFTRSLVFPDLTGMLDGILLANSLHFLPDPERVLERLGSRLRPGGRVVVIEYDRRSANPWVPYPIPPSRLETVLTASGFTRPHILATLPSRFSGRLYAAVSTWPRPAPP